MSFQCHFKVKAFKMAAISETTSRRAKISSIWAQRVSVDCIQTKSTVWKLTFQGHFKVTAYKMTPIAETTGRVS